MRRLTAATLVFDAVTAAALAVLSLGAIADPPIVEVTVPESAAAQEVIRAVMALRARDERGSGPIGLWQFGVPIAWTERDIAAQSYSVSRGLVEAASVMPRAMAVFAHPLSEESVDQLSSILDAQLFLVRRRQLSPSLEASPRVLFRNAVYAIVSAPPRQRAADGKVGRSTAHEIADVSTAKV